MDKKEAKQLVAVNFQPQHFLKFSRILRSDNIGKQVDYDLGQYGFTEKVYELIRRWMQINGNSATTLALAVALCKCGNLLLAQRIFPNIAERMKKIKDNIEQYPSALNVPTELDRAIDAVAESLDASDYGRLARHPDIENKNVKYDYERYKSEEIIAQLLYYWVQKKGDDATVKRLTKIVDEIGNLLLAQQICPGYKRQTHQKERSPVTRAAQRSHEPNHSENERPQQILMATPINQENTERDTHKQLNAKDQNESTEMGQLEKESEEDEADVDDSGNDSCSSEGNNSLPQTGAIPEKKNAKSTAEKSTKPEEKDENKERGYLEKIKGAVPWPVVFAVMFYFAMRLYGFEDIQTFVQSIQTLMQLF